MKFKGKIGSFIPVVLIFLLFLLIYGCIAKDIFVMIFCFLGIVFQLIWTLPNFVTISDNILIIKIGINNKNIDISKIESIEKSVDPRQSFATSLDRLKITYIDNESYLQEVMISLQNNDDFISTLKKINPLIIYK